MGDTSTDPGDRAVHLCIDAQKLFYPGWAMGRSRDGTGLAQHRPAGGACGRPDLIFTRFIPPRSADEAAGVWRTYYRTWVNITRDHLDTELLALVPPLQRMAPAEQFIDRAVYSAFGAGRCSDRRNRDRLEALQGLALTWAAGNSPSREGPKPVAAANINSSSCHHRRCRSGR
jgi:hypothetical protein